MSTKSKLTIYCFIVLGVALIPLSVLMVSSGQSVETSTSKQSPKNDEARLRELKAKFPKVSFYQGDSSDVKRKAKSAKYTDFSSLEPGLAGNKTVTLAIDWATGLPALPAGESKVIVEGRVLNASAHLSQNKKFVYSEFEIGVDKVFKDAAGIAKTEDRLFAERMGGVVQFPNDFETWVSVAGQAMPTVGKTYVFFLTDRIAGIKSPTKDLHILTAYEIDTISGTVTPLDNPGGGKHPISKAYRGKNKVTLISDLERHLQ
jgi:hypothetical protein